MRPPLPRITAWPLTVKVPLLVAGLVVAVAFVVSQVVLSRLARDQETNLGLLASAYLDGLSAAVLPAVVRADVWETFDALDRARGRYSGVKVRYALVELPDGTVLAASDPLGFPVKTAAPEELRRKFTNGDGVVTDEAAGRAWLTRTLRTEGFSVGKSSPRSTSPICCGCGTRCRSRWSWSMAAWRLASPSSDTWR